MNQLAILPRGGLGDVLYHALFAKCVQQRVSGYDPVLIAPSYGRFLTDLLGVRHITVESVLTDASKGLKLKNEVSFLGAFFKMRGQSLASFTNDVVDAGLTRAFGMKRFDGGLLGNSSLFVEAAPGGSLRSRVNRMLRYESCGRANPKHIVERQQCVLRLHGAAEYITDAYQGIWRTATAAVGTVKQPNTVLIFPETARPEKNITVEQIESIVRQLRPQYTVRIFTRDPAAYASLSVETMGFSDRLAPLRQIQGCAGVITADTFAAHLGGLFGVPTYTIYNFAYMPQWCEYWGAPFENVRHFENGHAYGLSREFSAVPSVESPLLFEAALAASAMKTDSMQSTDAQQFAAHARMARAAEPASQ